MALPDCFDKVAMDLYQQIVMLSDPREINEDAVRWVAALIVQACLGIEANSILSREEIFPIITNLAKAALAEQEPDNAINTH